MKKSILVVAVVAALSGLVGFGSAKLAHSVAEVQQSEGVMIFHQAVPIDEYEVVGRMEVGTYIGENNYKAVSARMLKRILKKYPDVQGVIFDENAYNAQIIKFK